MEFREWDSDIIVDSFFIEQIPKTHWNYFVSKLMPLSKADSEQISSRAFVGVGQPFHYKLARGWMGKVFEQVLYSPVYTNRGESHESALAREFGLLDTATSFVIYGKRFVYVTSWGDLLELLRRNWLMLGGDPFVVCAEGSSRAALYWEGTGFYFGNRGDRSLIHRHT